MDGILNIDKPAGITSYGVVARIKRLTGERRVGHAGTLDPAATGVLPVCLGRGTRVIEYMMDATKTYLAGIELGAATDTHDSTGTVIQSGNVPDISGGKLDGALESFRGSIRQTPPMFSAVKQQGQPLYKLAREGIEVPRESRPVFIHRLEVREWRSPLVVLEIDCSKGTYIRSIAHDLGQTLGCGAYLKDLVRLRYGVFKVEEAVTLQRSEDACREGSWPEFLFPVDAVLNHWSAATLNAEAADAVSKGKPVALPEPSPENAGERPSYRRAYTPDGRFLAVLRYLPETGLWHPDKVFI